MTFQIGEKVVYPNQGVATIENISSRSFGAQFEKFYLLRLTANSMTVMIPFSNVDHIGLRKITRGNEVSRILDFLSAGRCSRCGDWKVRFKQNTEKMLSGTLFQAAEVLKSLLLIQRDKTLSFREKRMLDRARQLLISEIAIARQVPSEAAVLLLEGALAKAGLKLPQAI